MKKALAVVLGCSTLAAAALAGPLTPFSFYGGYFLSNSFHNHAGNSVHFSGLELGLSESLISLPILGSVTLGGSVVLGDSLGGSPNGTLYRIFADYKTAVVPGTSVYGIGGFGYYYATGNSFSNMGGFGSEVGIGFPIRILPVGPGMALEARYRWGRAATTGVGVGLNFSF